MGDFLKKIKDLCMPAMIYFIISMFVLILVLFQNLGNTTKYNVGSFSCNVPSTSLCFIFKFIYVLFWTYVLNLICKDGHKGLSWLLLLLPFIFLFVIIGIIMINMK